MLFSWKKLAEQRGGRMGDIIDCLNCFHYTSAKSMSFLFYFTRFYIPSIFVFCIIFYTHTAQSYLPVYYRPLPMISIMNCFFFIIPHIVPEGFMSSAAVFMLRKYILSCSIFSFVCVIINKTTVELHAQWPVFLVISGLKAMWRWTI